MLLIVAHHRNRISRDRREVVQFVYTAKKRRARYSTGLNNVLLPTLFTVVNYIEQYICF
jgi:hypothetical protein